MARTEKPLLVELWDNTDVFLWLIVLPVAGFFIVIRLFMALRGADKSARKDSTTAFAFLLANLFFMASWTIYKSTYYGYRNFFEFLSRNTITVEYEHSVAYLVFWRIFLLALLSLALSAGLVAHLRQGQRWTASTGRAVLMTVFLAALFYGLFITVYAIGYSIPPIGWVLFPIVGVFYLTPSFLIVGSLAFWYFPRRSRLSDQNRWLTSILVYVFCVVALFSDFVWLIYMFRDA